MADNLGPLKAAALARGEVVQHLGMTLERRRDGLYIDGVRALVGDVDPTPAVAALVRSRPIDGAYRRAGESRSLPIPTAPIPTGAGARTVAEESMDRPTNTTPRSTVEQAAVTGRSRRRVVSVSVPVPDHLEGAEEAPPWQPLWTRADALLTAMSDCARVLIPLLLEDRRIALGWLDTMLIAGGDDA